jgi:hypothetical protein
MFNYMQYLFMPKYNWIPYVIIGVIIGIGILVGVIQGTKRTLIFFSLNITAIIIILIVFANAITVDMLKKIVNEIPLKDQKEIDAPNFLFDLKHTWLIPLFAIMLLAVNLTIIPLIYFFIWLIFLKGKKKIDWKSRTGGIVIAIPTSLLIATPLTATAFGWTNKTKDLKNNILYNSLNFILKIESVKTMYNAHELQDINDFILLFNQKNSPLEVITSIFGDLGKTEIKLDQKMIEKFNDKEVREKLKEVLNKPVILDALLKSIKMPSKITIDSKQQFDDLIKKIKDKIGTKGITPLKISDKSKDKVKWFISDKGISFGKTITIKDKTEYIKDILKLVIQ